MFYRFPYHQAGFSDEEWEVMPRGDRVLVRSYYLNGRDTDQTMLFDEFDTDYQPRKVARKYKLETRPDVFISLDHFFIL